MASKSEGKQIGYMPDELSKVIHDFIRPKQERWLISIYNDLHIIQDNRKSFYRIYYDKEKYCNKAHEIAHDIQNINCDCYEINKEIYDKEKKEWVEIFKKTFYKDVCGGCYKLCINTRTKRITDDSIEFYEDNQTTECNNCDCNLCVECAVWKDDAYGGNNYCLNCEAEWFSESESESDSSSDSDYDDQ